MEPKREYPPVPLKEISDVYVWTEHFRRRDPERYRVVLANAFRFIADSHNTSVERVKDAFENRTDTDNPLVIGVLAYLNAVRVGIRQA